MARRKNLSVKSIVNMSLYKISHAKPKALRSMYQALKKDIEKTIKVFKKHKASHNLPSNILNMKKVSELDNSSLAQEISRLSNFKMSNKSSYAKYEAERRKLRKIAEERLGIRFKNYAEYESYRDFMSEMAVRDKDNWNRHYSDAMELFTQARRLNLDPKQFRRNYDYWIDHSQELSKAKPIDRGNITPSDYAKQLKLPKIRGWRGKGE